MSSAIISRPMSVSKDISPQSEGSEASKQLGERPVEIHSGEGRLTDPAGAANCLRLDLNSFRDIDDIIVCDSDIDDDSTMCISTRECISINVRVEAYSLTVMHQGSQKFVDVALCMA